jgi:hypothetical protein
MKALLDGFDFDLIPMEKLGEVEDVALAFTNVNTIQEGVRVEAVLEKRRAEDPSRGPKKGGEG